MAKKEVYNSKDTSNEDEEVQDRTLENQDSVSVNTEDAKVSTEATEVSDNTELNVEDNAKVLDAEAKKEAVQPVKSKKAKRGSGKLKGAFSELKKVTWPSFGKVVKNTLVVLSVTAVFLLVVIGIDQLLYLLYNLLTKNM